MNLATKRSECIGAMRTTDGGRTTVPIVIGTYESESDVTTDVSILSGYAEGYDGRQFVVFGMGGAGSAEVSQAASEMLQPLTRYGFTISS